MKNVLLRSKLSFLVKKCCNGKKVLNNPIIPYFLIKHSNFNLKNEIIQIRGDFTTN